MNIIVVLLTLWLAGGEDKPPRIFTYTAKNMNECFAKIDALRDAITSPGVIGYSIECVPITGERLQAS